jgi:hypothetical protein
MTHLPQMAAPILALALLAGGRGSACRLSRHSLLVAAGSLQNLLDYGIRRLAQLVRALPSHGRGQRFEPASAYHPFSA